MHYNIWYQCVGAFPSDEIHLILQFPDGHREKFVYTVDPATDEFDLKVEDYREILGTWQVLGRIFACEMEMVKRIMMKEYFREGAEYTEDWINNLVNELVDMAFVNKNNPWRREPRNARLMVEAQPAL